MKPKGSEPAPQLRQFNIDKALTLGQFGTTPLGVYEPYRGSVLGVCVML
jgi:hypothetical protein